METRRIKYNLNSLGCDGQVIGGGSHLRGHDYGGCKLLYVKEVPSHLLSHKEGTKRKGTVDYILEKVGK